MENLFIYFLKSGGILLFFLATYFFLLRKDTLFQSHRWYFVLGLICSVLLPLFHVTRAIDVQKNDGIVSRESLTRISQPLKQTTEQFDWTVLLLTIYLIIAFFFIVRLVQAILSVRKVISNKKAEEINGQLICTVEEEITPFSFFSKIILNPNQYTTFELDAILKHEVAHCREKHTFDMLFIQLYCAIFWWNPFAWLYKKQLLLNLEYIADQKATEQIDDKKAYQFLLLKSIHANSFPAVANSFFHSPLKNRIVMMNTNPTKKSKAWKYMLILPAIFLFVGIFQIRYVAQETKNNTPKVKENNSFSQSNGDEKSMPQPPSNDDLEGMPQPPVLPDFKMPQVPNIKPPKNPNYEAGWAKYDAVIAQYEKEFAAYEKKMEPYYLALEKYEKDMEPFYKKMDEHFLKLEAYEKELDTWYKQFDAEFDKQYVEYEQSIKAKK